MVRIGYGRIKKREGKGKKKTMGGKRRGGLNAGMFSIFMVLC